MRARPLNPALHLRITFRASEPAPITSLPGPAFFDRAPLIPGSARQRPVGSEAAAGGRSRRPICYAIDRRWALFARWEPAPRFPPTTARLGPTKREVGRGTLHSLSFVCRQDEASASYNVQGLRTGPSRHSSAPPKSIFLRRRPTHPAFRAGWVEGRLSRPEPEAHLLSAAEDHGATLTNSLDPASFGHYSHFT